MWQEILTAVLVAIVGIVARYVVAYLNANKPDEFDKAKKYIDDIVAIVCNFFTENPEVAKTANNIYEKFTSEILKVLPWFTDEQIAFFFDSVKDVFADALDIDMETFKALDTAEIVMSLNYGVNKKPLFK